MPAGVRKGLFIKTDLILDDIPNIGSAYGLHQLSSHYQGAAVQILRGDNAVLDIGFLPSGDLDVNSIISFSPTSTVKIWYDQSGNGRNLFPVGNLIEICNNGNIKNINTKPCLDFHFDKGLSDTVSTYNPVYLFAVILSEYPTTQNYHKLYGKGWNGSFRGTLARIFTEGLHFDSAMVSCNRNGISKPINFTNELSPISQPALIDGEMITGVNTTFNGIGNYDNTFFGGGLLQATTISFGTVPDGRDILKIRNRLMEYYSIS